MPMPPCSAGLLQGVGKLYLLTRAARFPALLADAGTYQTLVAEWHGRLAEAILRNWELSDEIVAAVTAGESAEREHQGATDLGDVLAVASALAQLGPGSAAGGHAVPRHAGRAPHETRRRGLCAPRWPNRTRRSVSLRQALGA